MSLPDPEAETTQAIGSGHDPGDPDPPPVCEDTPNCSLSFMGGYSWASQRQIGCSQDYQYFNGHSNGFMGGVGSFCPDTSYIRNLLNRYGYRGYDHTYCDTCLVVPGGKIFFFSSEFWGPGCPSSCAQNPGF